MDHLLSLPLHRTQPASPLDPACLSIGPVAVSIGLSLPLHWTSCSAYLSIGPVAQPASPLDPSLDSACLSIGPVIGLSLPLHWTSHGTQPVSLLDQLLSPLDSACLSSVFSLPLHWTSCCLHWTQPASQLDQLLSPLDSACLSIGPTPSYTKDRKESVPVLSCVALVTRQHPKSEGDGKPQRSLQGKSTRGSYNSLSPTTLSCCSASGAVGCLQREWGTWLSLLQCEWGT